MGSFNVDFANQQNFNIGFGSQENTNIGFAGSVTEVVTTDYKELRNLPKINGVTLLGDRSFEDLGEESLSNLEIATIFNKVFGGN